MRDEDIAEQLNSALTGRYRVDREIGRGGWARVYLAEDLRHQRPVAIKVMSPDVASILGAERFLREIQIAATLKHPHIVPVFESGEAQGIPYYVMPFEGETLRDRLQREKQLPLKDAEQIALDVAGALHYAHRNGVVHRDIKPENIMLESGHALVADFGIAQALDRAGGRSLTASGVMLGTPTYMSPEQGEPGRTLDGRADIYSLGCVLYEMLGGQPPYLGPTAESLLYQHLSAAIPDVGSLRSTVPNGIRALLRSMLAKAPADRPQSGEEFRSALSDTVDRTSTETPAAPPPASAVSTPPGTQEAQRPRRIGLRLMLGGLAIVAAVFALWKLGVQPRSSSSPGVMNPELVIVADFAATDSSLADAVRDLVGINLSQAGLFRPLGRGELEQGLQVSGKPPGTRIDRDLAQELALRAGIRKVVVGEIRTIGRTHTVSVQVWDADSASVISSATEQAVGDDALIPAIGRIGRALQRALVERSGTIGRQGHNLVFAPTHSFAAVKLFRASLVELGKGNDRATIALSRRALDLDPGFVWAWSMLGYAFSNQGEPDSAVASFERALALPTFGEVDRLLREIDLVRGQDDVAKSIELTGRLDALRPPTAGSLYNVAGDLALLGRFDQALLTFRKSQEAAVFGPPMIFYWNEWSLLMAMNRPEDAARVSEKLSGPIGQRAAVAMALASADWSKAESLGLSQLNDVGNDPTLRGHGGLAAAAALAARGAAQSSRVLLARATATPGLSLGYVRSFSDLALLSDLLCDRKREVTDQTIENAPEATRDPFRGLWLAANDHWDQARHVLSRIDSSGQPLESRIRLAIAESLIETHDGRPERLIERLGPPARSGLFEGRVMDGAAPYLLRRLVANAWESLGQLDSAAVCCEQLINAAPGYSDVEEGIAAHAMAIPFAYQRLVLLYAQLGQYERAKERWLALSSLATIPDEDFQMRLDEARQKLASMQGMGQSQR